MAGFAPALEGFLIGAGLIVAIGAQNAFVLRQGLARRHVLPVTTVCFLSDVVLIAVGVAGLGSLVQAAPSLLRVVTLAGAAFLAAYAVLAFRRTLRPERLQARSAGAASAGAAVGTALALTFLNPHVYLDTVVLIGALSARHAGTARLAFAAGAAAASGVWFYGLGYGAALLAPLFARPLAWRVLDLAIGAVMGWMALSLLRQALSGA